MIFKTNDIRGIYPGELKDETVYRVGFFLKKLLDAKTIVVGRDGRESSPSIYTALSRGIMDSGADVIDIGLCDTPAVYFAGLRYGYDAAVMITASHNPPAYNGLKISGRQAVPIGRKSGLEELESLIEKEPEKVVPRGVEHAFDITKDYVEYLRTWDDGIHGLKCVLDCGNGAAGTFVNPIFKDVDLDFEVLFQDPDGKFPNHGPNPLEEENRETLRRAVLEKGADVGVCFDGDGDRAIFLDERGDFMSPDIITALIGRYFLNNNRPEELKVLYDIRSSRSVKEYIEGFGGSAEACPTGHARIKKLMKDKNFLWAGELAGHYYYRDNGFCDSAFITVMAVFSVLSREKKPLSSFRREINPYFFSGEINFTVKNIAGTIEELVKEFSNEKKDFTDGLRVDFPDWWFIVRESNAEPVLRLVIEAEREELMREKVDYLSTLIDG